MYNVVALLSASCDLDIKWIECLHGMEIYMAKLGRCGYTYNIFVNTKKNIHDTMFNMIITFGSLHARSACPLLPPSWNIRHFNITGESKLFKFDQIFRENHKKIYYTRHIYYKNIFNRESNITYLISKCYYFII